MDDKLQSAPMLVEWLRARADCKREPGLTPTEIDRAEQRFGFRFPPTWREVLGIVHPIAVDRTQFPDWRLRDDSAPHLVGGPIDGVLFDVERNGFWCRVWGTPPTEMVDRLDVAARELANVPKLVPLWSHLYVSDSDESPVFSIVQTDLYVPYLTIADVLTDRSEDSVDLDDYPIGAIPFWSDLHAWSQIGHLGGRFGALRARGTLGRGWDSRRGARTPPAETGRSTPLTSRRL